MTSHRNLEAIVAVRGRNSLGRRLLHFWQDEPSRNWYFCRSLPAVAPTQTTATSRHHGEFDLLSLSETGATMRYARANADAKVDTANADDQVDSNFVVQELHRKADAVFLGRVERPIVVMQFSKGKDVVSRSRPNQAKHAMLSPTTVRLIRDSTAENLVLESNGSVTRLLRMPEANSWVKLARYRSFCTPAPMHSLSQRPECWMLLEGAIRLWHAPDGGALARSRCRRTQQLGQDVDLAQSVATLADQRFSPGSVVLGRSTCLPRLVVCEIIVFKPLSGFLEYLHIILQWTRSLTGGWTVNGVCMPLR